MPRSVLWFWLRRAGRPCLSINLLIVLGVSACKNDEPLSPTNQASKPSQLVSLPSGQSFVIPIPPTSFLDVTPPHYVSSGITVPKGMSASMRFTGVMTASPSPECNNPGPTFEMYASGNRFGWIGNLGGGRVGWFIGPISGQGEYLNGWAIYPEGSVDPSGFTLPFDSAVAVWQPDLYDYNGEIVFRRDPFYSSCDAGPGPPYQIKPAYQLSGNQQVEVDFVTVDVGASKSTVQSNESVTFSAYPINFTPTNPTAIYWTFYTEANPRSPIDVESCYGQSNCTFTPPARGRMSVSMLKAGGPVPGYSATINVIKCPTGDPLLDNPRFRDSLLAALNLSGADITPFSARREVGGYLYNDATGELEIKFSYKDATPCGNTVVRPGTELAIFHTHPFNPAEGNLPADTLPFICFGASGLIYDAEIFGGPSAGDWRGSVDVGKDIYVIDKKRVYKTNHLVSDSTKWRDSTKVWDWNTASCKW